MNIAISQYHVSIKVHWNLEYLIDYHRCAMVISWIEGPQFCARSAVSKIGLYLHKLFCKWCNAQPQMSLSPFFVSLPTFHFHPLSARPTVTDRVHLDTGINSLCLTGMFWVALYHHSKRCRINIYPWLLIRTWDQ